MHFFCIDFQDWTGLLRMYSLVINDEYRISTGSVLIQLKAQVFLTQFAIPIWRQVSWAK